MPRVTAYGLAIDSQIALPELAPSTRSCDVRVLRGSVPGLDPDETGHAFSCQDDSWVYHFESAGTFRIRDGREIVVDPIAGAAASTLQLSILGPALALALIQRGLFLLHASAVDIAGSAVAFLGGHGFGKSTMAGLLHDGGHTVVTDDVAVLEADAAGGIRVRPSVPQFKFWPDTLESLGGGVEDAPILLPGVDKRGVAIAERFADAPVPLVRLFLLARGPAVAVTRVERAEALGALLPHWYGARFGEALMREVGPASVFRHFLDLVERVPVRRLERPALDLSDARARGELERAVVDDLS